MIVEAAAAVARSFSLVGALHRMGSGGPVFGLGEGLSAPWSCCLFSTVLSSLPVLSIPRLRLSSFSGCSSEVSQSSGDLLGHIQSTGSFSSIFFRSWGLNCLRFICFNVTVSISIASESFVVHPRKVWPRWGCCILRFSCFLCCLLSILMAILISLLRELGCS